MPQTDPRVDAYIDKAADFAKPVLNHIRKLVHKSCPDAVETIKWSFPHFEFKGRTLCSMAAFKAHCSFTFWLGSLLKDPEKILQIGSEKMAMGELGRITSVKDLPSDKVMTEYLKEAMTLTEQGAKIKKAKPVEQKNIEVPDYMIAALDRNKKAAATFEKFPPSHRKEYVLWITDAKTEATREKRLDQAIEWLAEGKSRNWKYER